MSESIDPECFSFDGLDEIVERIKAVRDAEYLVLFDRNEFREERVARLDLADCGVEGALPMGLEPPSLGDWLRQAAVHATVGDPVHKFRVRVYAGKGQSLYSAQFICRSDTMAQPAKLVPAEFGDGSGLEPGVARGMAALGDYYARFGHIVIGTMSRLSEINNAMVVQSVRQADADRARLNDLVSRLLDERAEQAREAAVEVAEAASADHTATLVKQTVDQLTEFGKFYVGAQGMTPDMIELGQILAANPELKDALNDPAVRTLMKNPIAIAAVAAQLKAAAAAATGTMPTS